MVVRYGVADGVGHGAPIDCTEIEERSQDVGAGDVAPSLRCEPLDIVRTMNHHPGEGRESSATDDDDVDRFATGTLDSPEVCRGTM